MNWDAQTNIVAIDGVVACEIADGSALLNIATSRYYKLNDTATLIWQELEKCPDRTSTFGNLVSLISSRYEVEETICRTDIARLFEGLSSVGLVRLGK